MRPADVWSLHYRFVVALVLLSSAVTAEAQLGGTWNVTMRLHLTDADGYEYDSGGVATIAVTQTGNSLSGTFLVPDTDAATDCTLTCDPATPGCAFQADLTGTVSGDVVDVTVKILRSLAVDCGGQCQDQQSYNEEFRLHGTVNGTTISGSLTEQLEASCSDGAGFVSTASARRRSFMSRADAGFCVLLLDCVGGTGTGDFQARLGGAPFPTPTPVLPHLPCAGDCSRDNKVTVDEIITGVNIALENTTVGDCWEFDVNDDGHVTVNELIQAVNMALNGCVFQPNPDCLLGDSCTGLAPPCPSFSCGPGWSASACINGRCVTGSCACASDVVSCCGL